MKVFLSFEPETAETVAVKLASQLRARGITPLSLNLRMAFDHRIEDKVLDATRSCDRILLLLNKAYLTSDWHPQEMHALLVARAILRRKDWVLPILLDDSAIPAHIRATSCSFDGDHESGFDTIGFRKIIELLAKPRQAFVVMPFDQSAEAMFECAQQVFSAPPYRYNVERIDRIKNSGSIPDQIRLKILQSDVVLADLTQERPNCYFEAGYADALEKEIIFTVRDGTKVHFDLAHRRQIRWEANALDAFAQQLKTHLDEIELQHFSWAPQRHASSESVTG